MIISTGSYSASYTDRGDLDDDDHDDGDDDNEEENDRDTDRGGRG